MLIDDIEIRFSRLRKRELTLGEIRVLIAVDNGSKTGYGLHKNNGIALSTAVEVLRRLRKKNLLQRTKVAKTRRRSWEHEPTEKGRAEIERTKKLLLEIVSAKKL